MTCCARERDPSRERLDMLIYVHIAILRVQATDELALLFPHGRTVHFSICLGGCPEKEVDSFFSPPRNEKCAVHYKMWRFKIDYVHNTYFNELHMCSHVNAIYNTPINKMPRNTIQAGEGAVLQRVCACTGIWHDYRHVLMHHSVGQ